MSRILACFSAALVLGAGGCSSDAQTPFNGASNSGGSAGSGATAGSNGGASTGGSTSGSGGTTSAGGSATGGSATSAGGSSNGGASAGGSTSAGGSGVGGRPTGADGGPLTADEVKGWIDAYKTAHPGNGGKDWDINVKTPAEVAADPALQRLRNLCGPDQLPVIPELAWEYGGNDHQWINPQASPLVICVYIAVNPSTAHWTYDAAADHITADCYVLFPGQNPCDGQSGAQKVLACIGDPSNTEIIVDTSSIHDGADVGLSLANSSTIVNLLLPDGSRVELINNP